MRDGKIDLADVKNNQEELKSYLREIKGNKRHRSKVKKKKKKRFV